MQDARRGNQVCFSYLKAKVILGDENDSDKMVACILHPASCILYQILLISIRLPAL